MVHYEHEEIAVFDTPVEKMFRYMSQGGHKHAAFKSHRLISVSGNVVTIEAEIYNPDGSTFGTTITHELHPQKWIQSKMTGGNFDGAKFKLIYTPIDNDKTRLDVEGNFPDFPGMSGADEVKMIDGFFTQVFEEDKVSVSQMK